MRSENKREKKRPQAFQKSDETKMTTKRKGTSEQETFGVNNSINPREQLGRHSQTDEEGNISGVGGNDLIKDITKQVRDFAKLAAQLTKLKIDLHNIKQEHENVLRLMGENLWNMHKADQLRNVKSKFAYDFSKLAALEEELSYIEKETSRIQDILNHNG